MSLRYTLIAFLLAMPGLLPLAWYLPLPLLGAFIAGVVFIVWFRRLLLRKVGGSTGDCLGFAACAGQLILLLAVCAA